MALVNHQAREVTFKIVYCGAPGSGKTTNLSAVHARLNPDVRGDLVSMATSTDSTVFFDYVHVDAVVINGYRTRFQLYTVPGQAHYNATRELLLRGTDGVIFVADSRPGRMEDNLAAYRAMRGNLEANAIDWEGFPVVFQYNKRDLPDACPVDQLDRLLDNANNQPGARPRFEACATGYRNVVESIDMVTRLILERFHADSAANIRIAPRATPQPISAREHALSP